MQNIQICKLHTLHLPHVALALQGYSSEWTPSTIFVAADHLVSMKQLHVVVQVPVLLNMFLSGLGLYVCAGCYRRFSDAIFWARHAYCLQHAHSFLNGSCPQQM